MVLKPCREIAPNSLNCRARQPRCDQRAGWWGHAETLVPAVAVAFSGNGNVSLMCDQMGYQWGVECVTSVISRRRATGDFSLAYGLEGELKCVNNVIRIVTPMCLKCA
jgi:hypothetical protein